MNWLEMDTQARIKFLRQRQHMSSAEIARELGRNPKTGDKSIARFAKDRGIPLTDGRFRKRAAAEPLDDDTEQSPWGMSEDKRRAYFAKRAAEGARKTREAQA